MTRHAPPAQPSHSSSVTLAPDEAYKQAVAAYIAGNWQDAEKIARAITGTTQAHLPARNLLGIICARSRRLDEAEAIFADIVLSYPDHTEAHNNRGNVLKELTRFDEALASYDRALALKHDYAGAHNNRGVALHALGRYDESLASHDRAIALQPNYVDAHNNRGNTLKALGRYDEALAGYDRALALQPDYAEAHWNKSLISLATGDYEDGWTRYEWRWKRMAPAAARASANPRWRGDASVAGKRVLLWGEQGFGDQIQFARYATMVGNLGATVILEVGDAVAPLLEGLPGVARVVPRKAALRDDEFDCHCPLMSLPLAFGTTLQTVPSASSYLAPPRTRKGHWTELGAARRPRVGIAWSGSRTHVNDRNRSIPLAQWRSLIDVPVEWISLQKDVREADLETLRTLPNVRHFGERIQDFADTAALCAQCDLVISVDTSVVHLAGAMGRPVWVLLPFCADWRWLVDRDDSPWYPSARLYRQQRIGDWDAVMTDVNRDLLASLAGMALPTTHPPLTER